MKYLSTRGGMEPKSFCQVLVMGLAPDGGLAVPESIPVIDKETLNKWSTLSYADLAFEIFKRYIDDISESDLKTLVGNVYKQSVFGTEAITPLRHLQDNLYILRLSNGPTLAFKDMAMQMIGELFEYVLVRNNRRLNIVGATSGDTGSAAEEAMIGKKNINVFMLSPHGRMSAFQQAQMFSVNEPNIFNIAVKGVFDDCQDIVKAINADAEFKQQYAIGAVNSINWARILAQVVYYFKGYFIAQQQTSDKAISFVVPSGNFGNVYAGFIAKQMGLPINKLVVATNENDVLDEFFKTAHYKIRPANSVHKTSSPSMDIGKASNFERYIYNLLDNDADKVVALWDTLTRTGEFDLSSEIERIKASGFVSGRSSHAHRLETIKSCYQDNKALIDPHTADGVFVAKQITQQLTSNDTLICLETALPAKFEETMQEALGFVPARPSGYEDIENKPKKVTTVDNDVLAVKSLIQQYG